VCNQLTNIMKPKTIIFIKLTPAQDAAEVRAAARADNSGLLLLDFDAVGTSRSKRESA